MRWGQLAMMFLLVCSALCSAQNYTCQADVFALDAYEKKPVVWSPDHSKHVQLFSTPFDDGNLSIYSGDALLTNIVLEDVSAGTLIKWAPDSTAVYVMCSDGGFIGAYHVLAFRVLNDRAIESGAPKAVETDFARHHYCEARGNNLYAIKWVDGSKELLLQPEVYPTGDCGPQLGFTSGYLVDVDTAEVKERYTASQMKKLAKGCPSKVFPGAFTSQEEVDKVLKNR